MQATLFHSARRIGHGGCIRQCTPPLPQKPQNSLPLLQRASGRPGHPVPLRRYCSNGAGIPAKQPDAGPPPACRRASDFLPEQLQRMLIVCKGLGMSVAPASAGMRADFLAQAADAAASTQAPGDCHVQPGLRLLPMASLYDPAQEHSAERIICSRLWLDGRQALHARNMALCYTLVSEQPWHLQLGGADLGVAGQEHLWCAELVFPANSLVHLNLAKGMLHGFEGKLGGTCVGFARQRPWGWFGHESRRCDEPAHGWDAGLLAVVDPARIRLIGGRAVPYGTVQHWQHTVALQKTADQIAWEIAITMLP